MQWQLLLLVTFLAVSYASTPLGSRQGILLSEEPAHGGGLAASAENGAAETAEAAKEAAEKQEAVHKMQEEGFAVHENECGDVHEELSELDKLWMTTLIITLLIALSLAIEGLTHYLKHKLQHAHLEKLLDTIFKELMIVGILSLTVFCEEKFGGLSAMVGIHVLSEERKELFEYVHVMLLVVILCYIFVSTCVMLYAMSLSNYFQWIEEHSEQVEEDYTSLEKLRRKYGTCCSWFRCCFRWRWERVKFQYDYLLLRVQFMAQHQLAEEFPNFHFYDYLRKSTRHRGLEFAEVNWRVWLASLVFVGASAALVKTVKPDMLHFGLIVVIITDTIALFVIWGWHRAVKIVDELSRHYPKYVHGGHRYKDLKKTESKSQIDEALLEVESESDEQKTEEHGHHGGHHGGHHEEHGEHEDHFENPKTPEAKRQSLLFPFRSPVIFVDILQLIALTTVMEVAIFAAYFYEEAHQETLAREVFYDIGLLFPPCVAVIFVPLILPRVIVSTSVGAYWDKKSLKMVKDKLTAKPPKAEVDPAGEDDAFDRVVRAKEQFNVRRAPRLSHSE